METPLLLSGAEYPDSRAPHLSDILIIIKENTPQPLCPEHHFTCFTRANSFLARRPREAGATTVRALRGGRPHRTRRVQVAQRGPGTFLRFTTARAASEAPPAQAQSPPLVHAHTARRRLSLLEQNSLLTLPSVLFMPPSAPSRTNAGPHQQIQEPLSQPSCVFSWISLTR